MKTWEMIKDLTENPEKEFISYIKKSDRDVLKTKSIKGAIRFSNEEDRWHEVLIGIDLEREWEEVKEPVDFMTAFKAWYEENKTIIYETDEGLPITYEGNRTNFSFHAECIATGKWYIED